LIIRRLIVPAVAAVSMLSAAQAFGQSAFPAPLPSQSASTPFPAPMPNQSGQSAAPAQSSPFPPVNGAAAASGGAFGSGAAPIAGGGAFAAPQAAPMGQQAGGEACMNDFLKLRKEAEKRGQAIQAAGKRRAAAAEACKLITSFSSAELAMIKYVVTNAKKCGIPPEIPEQLKKGHQNTEGMQQKVCNIAEQQQQKGPAGPSLSDVVGTAAAVPEANNSAKKFGGTTFDTLNGNVLQR
jgi:hypothetical protein